MYCLRSAAKITSDTLDSLPEFGAGSSRRVQPYSSDRIPTSPMLFRSLVAETHCAILPPNEPNCLSGLPEHAETMADSDEVHNHREWYTF